MKPVRSPEMADSLAVGYSKLSLIPLSTRIRPAWVVGSGTPLSALAELATKTSPAMLMLGWRRSSSCSRDGRRQGLRVCPLLVRRRFQSIGIMGMSFLPSGGTNKGETRQGSARKLRWDNAKPVGNRPRRMCLVHMAAQGVLISLRAGDGGGIQTVGHAGACSWIIRRTPAGCLLQTFLQGGGRRR